MSAHIPSRLKPAGLVRSDGKRPDGATLAPWKSGCLLVCDTTCPDTLAASYNNRVHATRRLLQQRRRGRAESIRVCLQALFAPIAIETLGAKDQRGDRRNQINGVPGSCLSVAVQRRCWAALATDCLFVYLSQYDFFFMLSFAFFFLPLFFFFAKWIKDKDIISNVNLLNQWSLFFFC